MHLTPNSFLEKEWHFKIHYCTDILEHFVNFIITGKTWKPFCVYNNWNDTFQPAGRAFVPTLHTCGLQGLFSVPVYTELCLLEQQNELFSELSISVYL